MEILIIGTYSSSNKGDAALRFGAIEALNITFRNPHFTIVSIYPELDKEVYSTNEIVKAATDLPIAIKYLILILIYKIFTNSNPNFTLQAKLLKYPLIKSYLNTDVVIHIGGDVLSDTYGLRSLIFHIFHILFGLLNDKTTMIYAESIGPFKYSKYFMRPILRKVDLITVRGPKSLAYLNSIRITNKPIYEAADAAFLMPSTDEDRLNELVNYHKIPIDKVIGISVSELIANKFKNYDEFIKLIADLIDFLTQTYGCTILLIPHVTGPSKDLDDRNIHTEIYFNVKNKDRVRNIIEDYTPQEMKGLIGVTNLFIGSRMHACIASLSDGVPTINIAYHYKSNDVLADFESESRIIKIDDLNFDILLSNISDLWKRKYDIKKSLDIKRIYINNKSLLSASLLKTILFNKIVKRVNEN